jgi:adenylosuccinate lyase
MKVWADQSTNLKDELSASEIVMKHLSKPELDEIFNPDKMLKNLDYIFARSVESTSE